MQMLRKDVRFALRSLRSSPGLTCVAILSLAFGIGVNTAAFSIIHPILLKPLPYNDAERLVLIAETNTQRGYDWFPAAPRNFQRFGELTEVFEDVTALDGWSGALTGSGQAVTLSAVRASNGFFRMLGVQAALGRTFVPEDDDSVIILTDGLWRNHFGADPGIVGRSITVDQASFTVIGVLPRQFQFGSDSFEAWRPLPRVFDGERLTYHSLQVIAKLRPGVSKEQANSRLLVLMEQLGQEYPKTNAGWGARVEGLQRFFANERTVARAMLAITLAVGFILLMACINVANLQLARASSRGKEIAIRGALGARRGRLIGQLLTESTVLALAGGALGFVLAYWAMRSIRQILPPITVFEADALELDWTAAAFTAGASILTALLFGIVPALRASRVELTQSLREGGRSASAGVHGRRFHNALVVSEVALALLVLAGAGLTLNSFIRLQNIETGFNLERLLTMRISLLDYKYPDEAQQVRFFSDALERVRRVPGVVSAAAVDLLPMRSTSGWFFDFLIEGRSAPDGQWPNAASRTITPGYFATMGIPLLRGREFTEHDDKNAPGVVIINQVLAEQFFPNEDPLGHRIHLSSRDPDIKWLQIVGVAAPVRQWSFGTRIFGKEAGSMAAVYRPHRQMTMPNMSLAIRAAGDPMSIANAVQQQIGTIDKDQPILGVRTMEDYVLRAHAGPRLNVTISMILGALALLLAISGIYGVMSYTVNRRSHELGVRMALGAERGDIFRLVLGHAMLLTGIGLVLGLIAALWLTRFMAGMLYEVSPTDLPTLVAVSVFLAGVALLASYRPAVRATSFDPLRNLRSE